MTGCSGGDGGAPTLGDAQGVFGSSCAGSLCHIGFRDTPAGGLDLTPGNECANLIGVAATESPQQIRVVPGSSQTSYLWCKLTDCPSLPDGASPMPLTGYPLPAADVDLITQWIDSGAPGCAAADSTPPTFAGASSATALPSAIQLDWSAATDDVTPAANIVYLIYEANASGGQNFATPSYTTNPGATSFTVGSLPVSTTRYYVVRARDGSGNTDDNTVEVSATTPATGDETPPGFAGATSATTTGSSAIELSWSAATDDVSPASSIRYRAYVATSAGGESYATPTDTSAPGATTMLITGLNPSTTYYAVVRAVDAAGNEDSNTVEVSATTTGPESFSNDVQPILTASCAATACHGFPMPQEGMDLRAGHAYNNLVNVSSTECSNRLRVAPGDPDNSYLVNKIEGTNLCFGTQMPKVGSLTSAEIAIIRAWVAQGAPNN